MFVFGWDLHCRSSTLDGACFEAQVDTTAFEDLPACDDYSDSDEEEQEA